MASRLAILIRVDVKPPLPAALPLRRQRGRSVDVAVGKPPDTSSSLPFKPRGGTSPVLFQVRQGVSVHDTHVVITVSPLLPEVPDYKVALLIHDLWRCWRLSDGVCFGGTGGHGLCPTCGTT